MPTHTRSRSRSDVDLRRSSRRDSHDEKREKKHRRRDSPSRSPSEDRRKHRSSRKTDEGSATKRKQNLINQSKHLGSSKPVEDEYVKLEAPPIKGGVV